MGLFHKEMENVVEWKETDENVIFHKWENEEIKAGSKLIIRPGQNALFYYNGRPEGIFREPGRFDIESEIIPFLSTLKGFRFGFDSGLRAEVLFVNTKEFLVPWGTQNPVNIPAQGMPGGIPIRANGTAVVRVSDDQELIDRIAGVRDEFTVEDLKERISAVLNPLLMKWIQKEGKDMFNLQANATEIGAGIRGDLDAETMKFGMTTTGFSINSFNYPKEIQDMITKNASVNMMGNVEKYQQVAMAESMEHGGSSNAGSNAAGMAGNMAGMMMGMQMAKEMAGQMNSGNSAVNQNTGNSGASGNAQNASPSGDTPSQGAGPNFCPNCGAKVNGARFCPNCGTRLRD